MMHRWGTQRRFEGRTIDRDTKVQNQRTGMILLVLIAVLYATAVISVLVLN